MLDTVLPFCLVHPIVDQLTFYPTLAQTKTGECSKQSGKFKVAELNKGVRDKHQNCMHFLKFNVNLLNFELVLLNTTSGGLSLFSMVGCTTLFCFIT